MLLVDNVFITFKFEWQPKMLLLEARLSGDFQDKRKGYRDGDGVRMEVDVGI